MSETIDRQRGMFWWGAASVSVLLHLLLAAALFLHMPQTQTPKEEPIQVEIVTPKQEEAKKEEPKPQPAPAPAKKEPPPPPQQPDEAAAKLPDKDLPMPMLKSAIQFGDKTDGPQMSKDGDAAKGDVTPDQSKPTPDEQKPAETAEKSPPEAAKPDEKPPVAPVPDKIDVPKAQTPDVASPQDAKPAESLPKALAGQTAPPSPADAPKTPELTKARKLYSEKSGGKVAMEAMAGLSREVRVARLCSTELAEQLRHGKPAFHPDILPAPRLKAGTVAMVPVAAFRTRSQWYDLSFRCEIDEGATKVVSFAYHVGNAIPRSAWKARGFPEN